ncbi:MAG: carbamoyltransferase HypF [Gammaproteobacteria bacterium]|nr:carbamoyltransferase HypF [Gammaproteobacteria bacterium]
MIETQRLRIELCGVVQGVGFRPFVYRLAVELGLAGWAANTARGLTVEVEGSADAIDRFLERLMREKPPHAIIQRQKTTVIEPAGERDFTLRESLAEWSVDHHALILPDLATCPDCIEEIFDADNRRYRYPFTNCTQCGPRYSIIEALPYDRAHTTLRHFVLCPACAAEYNDPHDRRFHAQPIACPDCGPRLALWDAAGTPLASNNEALLKAAESIRGGATLAVKGLGGFHLMVDARNKVAVRRLRDRKRRTSKPFAVMFSTLGEIKAHCEVSDIEEHLLLSAASPIVLLKRQHGGDIASCVSPENPYLGVMLPYTPLHYLLLGELGFPVVATSGNLSGEPICTDEFDALDRLRDVADFFLVHDRPIARPVDDSVVRVVMGRALVLRRARGYAPLPIEADTPLPAILAVGGHLKNTVALSLGNSIVLSQPVGDLGTTQAAKTLEKTVADLNGLYTATPCAVACDTHPDYYSSQFANRLGLPLIAVQHHYAHVLSCMADNGLDGPVLGVAWDGTGLGTDGTLWGGEFLRITETGFERAAHLRTFMLPGAEQAIRQPRRAALGLLFEIFSDDLFTINGLAPMDSIAPTELGVLRRMMERGINTPCTSSAGRLFDVVSALLGLCQISDFEGQAAMALEFAAEAHGAVDEAYPFRLEQQISPVVVNWAPMIHGILNDLKNGLPKGRIAAKFHNTLADIIATVATALGEKRVALTGGCFQNSYLTCRTVERLRDVGCTPYWHQHVPPNDGGLALGQIIAAARVITSDFISIETSIK